MAQQFLNLDEAADALGIKKEKLAELREEGRVRAFRDGAGWKFKSEEIDRLRGELVAGDQEESFDFAPLGLDDENEADSILLSELELGGSGSGPSSTIIGKNDNPADFSDVRLADAKPDSDLKLSSDSDLSLSDVSLASGGSDVLNAAGKKAPGPDDTKGPGSNFENLEELELSLDSESSKIVLGANKPGSGKSGSGKPGSKKGVSDSSLQLASDDDDEMVLGEGPGSDITLKSGDSGISLNDPADSGLSLDEEPLSLGGSAVESLELGEDDLVSLEEEPDYEAATQLKADDDFLLTPLDDAGAGDDDSGSQVIALDSESFDDSANTMLGSAAAVSPLVTSLEDAPAVSPLEGGAPAAAPLSMMSSMTAPEAPYTVWNVMSLMLCVMVLAVTGMMMYDLVRNIWSFDQPFAANSKLMDALMETIPIFGK